MLDQRSIPSTPPDYLAENARTIGEMFISRAQKSPEKTAWLKKIDGTWQETSFGDFFQQAEAIAASLIEKGLNVGDKICIVGSTRPEWWICDMAGLLAGAVTVGAYPTLANQQLAYVLEHSDTRLVIAEGRADVEKLLAIKDSIPDVEQVYVWDVEGLDATIRESDWLSTYDELLAGTPTPTMTADRQAQVQTMDTAILVYTSGTTGPPKGAMISHHNVMQMLTSASKSNRFDADDISISFLPMAHVAERVLASYGRMSAGTTTAYATSIAKVLEEVVEVRPTTFGSVPRIFEKAYAKIMSGVQELTPGKKKVFDWAEAVGREVVKKWQAGEPIPLSLRLKYKIADRLIFSKLRNVFGGRVRQFITGAAPISYEILEFFWAAGFPIYEVYGQTEATTMTHGNSPGSVKIGSVGKALDGVETRIADDGEILVRGDLVFQGYYKNESATADTIDQDGWLYTGDIGKVDDDGFYYIVDRKKHIIITAGGKNLTPANIENEIKTTDPLISQVHVHGDKRPYITAIVTVAPAEAIDYAAKNGLLPDNANPEAMILELTDNPLAVPAGLPETLQAVAADPTVRRRLADAVARGNANLAKVETIKRFYIPERDFSVDHDELTPTLKVKRKNVEEKYMDIFNKLYDDDSFGIVVG